LVVTSIPDDYGPVQLSLLSPTAQESTPLAKQAAPAAMPVRTPLPAGSHISPIDGVGHQVQPVAVEHQLGQAADLIEWNAWDIAPNTNTKSRHLAYVASIVEFVVAKL
jgi:hypothetical protein